MVDAPGGLGGGRFKPYVKAIIEAEKAPIRLIEARKAKDTDRLKLLQEFSGKVRKMTDGLREVDNFKSFRELKADFGKNEDMIGLEMDKNIAEPGEYQLEIVQLAGRNSIMSNGFEDPEAEIGVGFFSYETPDGESKSVYLNSNENTVAGLVKAINSEKDLGLQAMVVNDGLGGDEPWHVIVTGKKTGMNNDIIYPDFYFVDGDVQFGIEEEREAQSAIVKLNGFEILCDKNKVSNLIPGVTLDLKQAKEGYEFEFSIKEDVGKIAGKVKGLVENVNAVLEFINKQNQLDERTDTSRTLGGDGMLRGIESQIRSIIQTGFLIGPEDEEKAVRASEFGVQFERTGLVSFNQDKFQKALSDDFDKLAEFFAGENKFIDRFKKLTSGLVGVSGGILIERERGFKERSKRLDDDIARKENQIAKKEEGLKRQFATLEATITNMQGQQQYLAQALGGGGPIPGL